MSEPVSQKVAPFDTALEVFLERVTKCADWFLDLGPEGGHQGGRRIVSGTPETVAACPRSHTGRALRPHLALANQGRE